MSVPPLRYMLDAITPFARKSTPPGAVTDVPGFITKRDQSPPAPLRSWPARTMLVVPLISSVPRPTSTVPPVVSVTLLSVTFEFAASPSPSTLVPVTAKDFAPSAIVLPLKVRLLPPLSSCALSVRLPPLPSVVMFPVSVAVPGLR